LQSFQTKRLFDILALIADKICIFCTSAPIWLCFKNCCEVFPQIVI